MSPISAPIAAGPTACIGSKCSNESDSGVLIRNLAARGKHPIETVEHVIEPDLLYPLLRWGDVGRYSATPAAHLLLTQDPATRLGIDESVMQAKYPRTLAYSGAVSRVARPPRGLPPLSAERPVLRDVQRRALHCCADQGCLAADGSADQRGGGCRQRRPVGADVPCLPCLPNVHEADKNVCPTVERTAGRRFRKRRACWWRAIRATRPIICVRCSTARRSTSWWPPTAFAAARVLARPACSTSCRCDDTGRTIRRHVELAALSRQAHAASRDERTA